MKLYSLGDIETSPQVMEDIAQTLRNDGTVCFPTSTTYRLATNILSPKAVIRFLQVKRRTGKAPLLVFVPSYDSLHEVVQDVPSELQPLMDEFWPGALTLLFDLSKELPKKVLKNLKGTGKVGVRIPEDPLVQKILEAFGGPLLISSANKPKKSGAYSEASIKKHFANWVDVMISAGDLSGSQGSTIVDGTTSPPRVIREGSVSSEDIAAFID